MIDVEIDSKYSNEIDFDSLNADSKGKGIQFDTFLQHSLDPSDIVTFIVVTLPQGLAVNVVYDLLKFILLKLDIVLRHGKYSFKVTINGKFVSIESSDPITDEMKNKLIDEVIKRL